MPQSEIPVAADADAVDKVQNPASAALVTVGGAARIVGRSTEWIRGTAREIGLADVRAGGIRVFDAAAVARLISEKARRDREAR